MRGTIETTDVDGAVIVALVGEHDAETCEYLGELIECCFDQHPVVVVDLLGVTFIDSTVLRGLLTGHRHHQREPRHTFGLVVEPSTFPERVLHLTAIDVIPTFPTREAALGALVSSRQAAGD